MAQLDGISLQQPTEEQGFLVSARAMLAGARPLLSVEPRPVFAITMLCGHGAEAALKALLAHSGLTEKTLSKKPFGHDLISLWSEAASVSGMPATPPDWIHHLNRVHATYRLRYPLGFHAIVLPHQQLMVQGLEQLVSVAAAQIG